MNRENTHDNKCLATERHRILASWHCRAILDELHAHDPLNRDELATHLRARSDAPEETRTQLAVKLRHCHLPKLVDAGVLREINGMYRLTPRAWGLLTHMDHSEAFGGDRDTLAPVVGDP